MRRTSLIHTITKFLKMCDKEKTLESNHRENYTLHTYILRNKCNKFIRNYAKP